MPATRLTARAIVAMIRCRTFRAGHASRVAITITSPAGRESGLLGDFVVMTDNVATVALAANAGVAGLLVRVLPRGDDH